MTENPYRLARDIRGIGFKTADAIAMKLGVEKTAMMRIRAGISYALTEAMDEGHCGLPIDDWRLLPKDCWRSQWASFARLDLELADGAVITDTVGKTSCVFLAGLYRAERFRLPQKYWVEKEYSFGNASSRTIGAAGTSWWVNLSGGHSVSHILEYGAAGFTFVSYDATAGGKPA